MKLRETRLVLKAKGVTFHFQSSWVIDVAVSIVMVLIGWRLK